MRKQFRSPLPPDTMVIVRVFDPNSGLASETTINSGSAGSVVRGGQLLPLGTAPLVDSDGDLLLDAAEIAVGTDPFETDSDKDGTDDFVEAALDHTDAVGGRGYDKGVVARIEVGRGTEAHDLGLIDRELLLVATSRGLCAVDIASVLEPVKLRTASLRSPSGAVFEARSIGVRFGAPFALVGSIGGGLWRAERHDNAEAATPESPDDAAALLRLTQLAVDGVSADESIYALNTDLWPLVLAVSQSSDVFGDAPQLLVLLVDEQAPRDTAAPVLLDRFAVSGGSRGDLQPANVRVATLAAAAAENSREALVLLSSEARSSSALIVLSVDRRTGLVSARATIDVDDGVGAMTCDPLQLVCFATASRATRGGFVSLSLQNASAPALLAGAGVRSPFVSARAAFPLLLSGADALALVPSAAGSAQSQISVFDRSNASDTFVPLDQLAIESRARAVSLRGELLFVAGTSDVQIVAMAANDLERNAPVVRELRVPAEATLGSAVSV